MEEDILHGRVLKTGTTVEDAHLHVTCCSVTQYVNGVKKEIDLRLLEAERHFSGRPGLFVP
jgi:hypothetical protein